MALTGNKRPSSLGDQENAYSSLYSLSATILRRRIIGALQSTVSKEAQAAVASINQNTVYAYPTVDRLTSYLLSFFADSNMATEGVKSHIDQMETMIAQYSNPWPKINGTSEPGTIVLLTGSTGNIGSHILEALLQDSRILRIYAFNRSSSRQVSLLDRHIERFEDKGFDKGLLTSKKLVSVEGDASQDNLGVSPSVFNEVIKRNNGLKQRLYLTLSQLRKYVDVIIHSAWRLDFNLSLSSFDSNVRGTRNLIDFAHDTVNVSRLKFIFTSSVATADSWGSSQGPYPEKPILDGHTAVGSGYGESKYVCERVRIFYFSFLLRNLSCVPTISSSFSKPEFTRAL